MATPIELIQKLLQLATNNPNEEEARSAALKVCQLLKEHEAGIEVAGTKCYPFAKQYRRPRQAPPSQARQPGTYTPPPPTSWPPREERPPTYDDIIFQMFKQRMKEDEQRKTDEEKRARDAYREQNLRDQMEKERERRDRKMREDFSREDEPQRIIIPKRKPFAW